MPKGTPSDKLAAAVRAFALDRFELQHRYAMAFASPPGNPHVHLVVRALSERACDSTSAKRTLRDWRQRFAAHLREQGIAANATERAVRGATRVAKTDGAFRSDQRDSVHLLFRRNFLGTARRAANQPEREKQRSLQPVAKWSAVGTSFPTYPRTRRNSRGRSGHPPIPRAGCVRPRTRTRANHPGRLGPARSETQTPRAADPIAMFWRLCSSRRLRREHKKWRATHGATNIIIRKFII